jgi:adenosylcobinamide kinase/adenosylcobinamide-phosphate guanylyltransferase
MERQLVLILGGARSGKSTYAERVAADLARVAGAEDRVLYVATAQALDDEMARRIARHRAARPRAWRTLEEPLDLGAAIAAAREDAAVVLVDCVTIWLSNLLLGVEHDVDAAPDAEEAAARAGAAVDALLRAYHAGTASTLLVSNEVGMGLVPPYPLGRIYRDLLGQVNAKLAAEADRVVLMVAGLPLPIKPMGVASG